MSAPTRSTHPAATSRTVDAATVPWTGPWRPYDIVKEVTIAVVVVAVLTAALAALFSSPDERPVTIQRWAKAAPTDFVATALTELDGSSGTAGYGPPYNATPGAGQQIGPVHTQRWPGVRIPVNTAQDFVLGPLGSISGDPALRAELARYRTASLATQQAWDASYASALAKAPAGDPARVPAGRYGPVPALLAALLVQARSGGLDGYLTTSGNRFYTANYTKPLLFLADGGYLAGLADAQHLSGDQWGMMNETGSYPGQAWLWLYTFWYQISPFKSSGNADALVWGIMALLSLLLVLVPFLPGVRSVPRRLGLYRLVWRDYYRAGGGG